MCCRGSVIYEVLGMAVQAEGGISATCAPVLAQTVPCRAYKHDSQFLDVQVLQCEAVVR